MSQKRIFSEIAVLTNSSQPPRKKRQRVEDQDAHYNAIFDVLSVRDIILDFLSFSYENISIFVDVADDNYLKRRLMNLKKNEVLQIKENIDQSSKDGSKYNIYYISMFYANFKILFGEKSFHMLLDTPVSRLTNFHRPDLFSPLTLNDSFLTTIMRIDAATDSNNCQYLYNIEILLRYPKNIEDLFDQNQQLFLQKHDINVTKLNKIEFQTQSSSTSDSTPEMHFKYEILTANTEDHAQCALGFEFQQLQSKPRIVTVPIWKPRNETAHFHTNSLLSSVERILILRKIGSKNRIFDTNPFVLHLNHKKDFNLNKIFICGNHDNDFDVNIKCYKNKTTDTFGIFNVNNKCNISSNLFDTYTLQLTDNEIDFIQKCKADNTLNLRIELNDKDVNYSNVVFEDRLIIVLYQSDIYYFKLNQKLELILVGWTVTDFPATWIHINTCDIPCHWIKMNVGGLFSHLQAIIGANTHANDDNIYVEMDGFSDNMLEFSINRKSICFHWNMDYNSIPENMKFIRVPHSDYDYVLGEQFTFLIDKTLDNNDLPYKQIQFKFHEMLFSDIVDSEYFDNDEDEEPVDIHGTKEIDEYRLEKLLNPVFNTAFDRRNIVVYHRK